MVIVAVDNSLSIAEVVDSVQREQFLDEMEEQLSIIENNGFSVKRMSFDGEISRLNGLSFNSSSSNLSGLLRKVEDEFDGRNLNGLILVSDGIYNSGSSPIFKNYNFELSTIGLGDSIAKNDLSIINVRYNKISYQGNKFPLQILISNVGFEGESTSVTLRKGREILESKTIQFEDKRGITQLDFLIEAKEPGNQRYSINVKTLENEFTETNNSQSVFIEIVEGKENILLLSERPHPDIKAIKEAVESNPNYSFETYIRGISTNDLQEKKYDLVICHQCVGNEGFIKVLGLDFSNIPLWIFYGKQLAISQFNGNGIVDIKNLAGEYDLVTPVANPAFSHFEFSDELKELMLDLPPLVVPFGDLTNSFNTESLLFQQIGSIATARPLMVLSNEDPRKAVTIGEGIWRWKLHDFLRNEDNKLFNEFISKTVQYLSTRQDKKKLRVYPIESQMTNQSVTFETEVYDDLYERIYGVPISIRIRDEAGDSKEYTYSNNAENSRYQISGLVSGVYDYIASASTGGTLHTSTGQFVIMEQQVEFNNLTADFVLLRRLANENEGLFLRDSQLSELSLGFAPEKAKGIIHSYESYNPFINLPWIFVVLLVLASTEWFTRKYFGVY